MYQPSKEVLDKYADVLINCALNGGEGVKEGEVVLLSVPEVAKLFLIALRRAVLKAGAHPIVRFAPDDMEREFYELASQKQLEFFADKYLKGLVDQMDHYVGIIADTDLHELEGIDAGKLMDVRKSVKPFREWMDEKEDKGELTWTVALYGTEGMAKEAGMSLEDYWNEIIRACYLDEENPVEKWREIFSEVDRIKKKLDDLKIEKLRVKAEGIDLRIGIGKHRVWKGGGGNNIPSYEVYISPDWRKTEGHIRFNKPLYRYGNLIEGVYLEFNEGRVVRVSAGKGEDVLNELIAVEGADKVGEFSLTDSRLSRIKKFMAETLFDENAGGEFGNTHIALGSAYKDCYPGDPSEISKEQWGGMGYNESVIHTDIVSTENREVTASLEDGREIVIYRDGKFII